MIHIPTKYRHEWKHFINETDLLCLRQRLQTVLKSDPHAKDGKYLIRSLYFDTPTDRALREKINGVDVREKFRLRYYNGDPSFIRLEKKSKRNGLGRKLSAPLSSEEVFRLLKGDLTWMMESGRDLIRELYCKMRAQCLRPKTIVDYIREPFLYRPGNVRVTLDYNIRTATSCYDFLNPDCITIPAGDGLIVLEVKWDEYLPTLIRDCVQTPNRRVTAFSKYAQCRIYG